MTQNKEQSTKNQEHISGIILAAGQSKRMGAFKPLLPFGSKTVIESCVNYLADGGVETIVVVIGQNGESIKQKLQGTAVHFALNPDPESAMSNSIKYGVSELPSEAQATFITPADHPAVPAAVVAELAKEWRKGGKILVPEFHGRGGHPVLIDLCLRNELVNLDAARGLRALFETYSQEVRRIPVGCPFVARDMDTWDDYRLLHEDVFGVAP
ncbi:MAG TPA: nucleotidyltransferase family protein [Pyrinomonadaceae bacterium]|nr:nucleotidyltransferase family protein [Pyrinomonadaceae bacterium]